MLRSRGTAQLEGACLLCGSSFRLNLGLPTVARRSVTGGWMQTVFSTKGMKENQGQSDSYHYTFPALETPEDRDPLKLQQGFLQKQPKHTNDRMIYRFEAIRPHPATALTNKWGKSALTDYRLFRDFYYKPTRGGFAIGISALMLLVFGHKYRDRFFHKGYVAEGGEGFEIFSFLTGAPRPKTWKNVERVVQTKQDYNMSLPTATSGASPPSSPS